MPRAEKILSRINELASVSEAAKGITRRYGTAAAVEAGEKVRGWMRAAGLRVRVDAIGNIRGIWKSENAGADRLVIASHIDTVIDAGRWDGPLGVVMGLDLLENIISSGRKLPFDVELIAFCDEEGVRFHTTYLGSKVVAGSFERDMLDRKDGEGVSLREVIGMIGGNVEALEGDAIPPDQWLGYFEIHIEQGPVLYEKKAPVALVKGIAGQVRAEVVFKGMAGHAGTVPMDMRKDALCGAAAFILAVEELAARAGSGLVATVGKLQIANAASNVIPGEVVCSVDIRSADEVVLSQGHLQLKELCEAIGAQRALEVIWTVVQSSSPVVCDGRMNELLGKSIRRAGYEVLELVSGAGHDAVPISAVSPVCMLFVRCYKGISHHPQEHVETEDLAAAIVVADEFIHQLSEIWKYPL
ncbi:M20 family metallo-hydrolase [Flavitalea sp. BT771]|uniref:M20 family metallo-hydrolase n=1 Tax=Flavitalea sp. BT771 TaxID=3063329 RepID=UPI0026E3CA88|nr:M20 family metallo-hydrolase [Flavitalea sp. BT771]MDO6431901.1 M20 family metallo-hydrolase [Flavitalea sp. BT771]MDV6220810.1 M20 family metallo-hydrolase [Flavitalea sp. BT771]